MIYGYIWESIPLEGIWIDQSYLSSDQDFKVNTTAFTDLQFFAYVMRIENQRVCVAVKASLAADVSNVYYN